MHIKASQIFLKEKEANVWLEHDELESLKTSY